MRDHTLKEVAFYNHLFRVPSVFTPAIDTKAPEKASIHRLMEAFILRLQTLFPSTVSTVYRTSEKLVKAPREGCAAGPSGPSCLLCMCALDIDTAGSCRASLGWGAVVLWLPQGPLSPSLLQTVPRPLGLSPPHISPRCRVLRLGCLPSPAVLQGRVRPRAAIGKLARGGMHGPASQSSYVIAAE